MWKLSFLNVSRRKTSTTMTVMITAVVVLVTVLISSLSICIYSGLKISEQRMGADIIIYPNSAEISDTQFLYSGIAQMVYMESSVIDNMLPADDIEAITPQFFLQTLPGAGCCATDEEFRIVGIDKDSDFIVSPWYNTEILSPGDMLIGNHASWQVDMNLFLLGNTFKIIDRISETGTSIDDSIFIDIEAARQIAAQRFTQDDYHYFNKNENLDNLVTCYLIKLKEGVSPPDFISEVKNNGINAQISSVSGARAELSRQLINFSKILMFFAIIIIFLGCLALYSQFVNLTAKMQREIGYLRSIGLRKKDVYLIIFNQVCLMSGIGGIIGSITGILLLNPALVYLQSIIVIPVEKLGFNEIVLWVIAGMIFSVIICFLSAITPIIKSVRKDPTKVINEGEI
jgi:putative ABC transport system permease protein